MADLPANTNAGQAQTQNKQDNKFDKLTPILEYTYIVLYNMLNTLRSMKNYVDIYAQDMRLTELEQYDKASVTLEKAIEDMTKAGKAIGSIYGLPEEMLDPQKMAQELAKQMKNMPMPQTPASQPNTQPQQPAAPTTQPSTSATNSATATAQMPNASASQPATAQHNQQTEAPTPTASQPGTPSQPAAPSQPASTPTTNQPNNNTANNSNSTNTTSNNANTTASSNEDEEIKKILEQLKALRQ